MTSSDMASNSGAPVTCPLGVPGTRIEVTDTAGGVDLTLTSDPDRVAELQVRARDAANLGGAGTHSGLGHDGDHLGSHRHGLRLTSLPPVQTSVDDLEAGARIHVTALVPAHAEAVRDGVRENVAIAIKAVCHL